jgi:putative heme degradation protein
MVVLDHPLRQQKQLHQEMPPYPVALQTIAHKFRPLLDKLQKQKQPALKLVADQVAQLPPVDLSPVLLALQQFQPLAVMVGIN